MNIVEKEAQQNLIERGCKVIQTVECRPKKRGSGLMLALNHIKLFRFLNEANDGQKAYRTICMFMPRNNSVEGLPDFTCIDKDGDVFFVEVKSGRARLTKRQKYFMSFAKSNGFEAFTMREDLELVKE